MASPSESDIKRKIVKEFRDRGHYARRIEDSFSVGFPDMIIMMPAMPVFFVEAKIIRGVSFGPTPRQHIELSRLSTTHHSFTMWLGWKDGQYYTTHHLVGAASVHINDCIKQKHGETLPQLFERTLYVGRQEDSSDDTADSIGNGHEGASGAR